MKADELLRLFHLLMKKKHEKKISGSWECKAHEREALRLKEHYFFALGNEGCSNHDG